LTAWERDGVQRIVPALYTSECANALYQKSRSGLITAPDALRGLDDLLAAVRVVPVDAAIARRALQMTLLLGARAAYDSFYLAVAEQQGCEFWTGDRRFYDAVRSRFPIVRWVEDAPG
jgi:predicted nucleic acid-binding protein